MKTVVAVVVYNRIENIKIWLQCWKLATKDNAELVVIHNNDGVTKQMETVCTQAGVQYISRKNIGYDIGALQDVAMARLAGFPEFDWLLWCTDDVLPMHRDFIRYFDGGLKDTVYCMEISREVRQHIRTTGFCIHKSMLEKIQFAADPIKTKEDCYAFEHRGLDIFLRQVQKAGGSAIQVADIERSYLWDTGHKSKAAIRRYARRQDEFNSIWRIEKLKRTSGRHVVVICPIYNSFPEIITSMLNQTHKDWTLRLIHDGPNATGLRKLVESFNDKRIQYSETDQRSGNWGHSIRAEEIQQVEGDYIVITNADNYHVPTYLEYMLKGFHNGTVATYCSHMVHNYIAHKILICSLQRGFIDCAGVMVKADIAKAVGWRNTVDHSADWMYFQDIARSFGWNRFTKVEGCLLVHN